MMAVAVKYKFYLYKYLFSSRKNTTYLVQIYPRALNCQPIGIFHAYIQLSVIAKVVSLKIFVFFKPKQMHQKDNDGVTARKFFNNHTKKNLTNEYLNSQI